MLSSSLTVLALVGAGFAFGVLGTRAAPARPSLATRMALIVICLPFVGLLLASVLRSEVLGWISGLSLMIGLPVLMLFVLGTVVGSLFRRRRLQPAAIAPLAAPAPAASGTAMLLRIDRDSVHAGDDGSSHALNLMVGGETSLAALVQQIRSMGFLPSIAGGQATWVIESLGPVPSPVGVLAQQWPEPAFTVRASALVSEHCAGPDGGLFFRYRCQDNPDQVLAQISAH